jgi:hypothetical protein
MKDYRYARAQYNTVLMIRAEWYIDKLIGEFRTFTRHGRNSSLGNLGRLQGMEEIYCSHKYKTSYVQTSASKVPVTNPYIVLHKQQME